MIAINLSPFPILETKRLLLREIDSSDVKDVFSFRSNEEAMKYISRPIAKTEDDVLTLINLMKNFHEKEQGISWGICYKENSTIIGTIGYVNIDKENHRGEIGYMLHPDYHRKGIMQEAIETIINVGFQQFNFHSISATIHPDNIASRNILLKNKFVQEAHFKEDFFYNGVFMDTVIFGLLKKSYLQKLS